MSFEKFLQSLQSEEKSNPTDLNLIYIDMVGGDILAGIALSEIVRLYLYDQESNNNNEAIVYKNGYKWVALTRYQWWDRCRLSPNQVDRVLSVLCNLGIIEKEVHKLNGDPVTHIRIIRARFLSLWSYYLKNDMKNPYEPDSKRDGNNKLPKPLPKPKEKSTSVIVNAESNYAHAHKPNNLQANTSNSKNTKSNESELRYSQERNSAFRENTSKGNGSVSSDKERFAHKNDDKSLYTQNRIIGYYNSIRRDDSNMHKTDKAGWDDEQVGYRDLGSGWLVFFKNRKPSFFNVNVNSSFNSNSSINVNNNNKTKKINKIFTTDYGNGESMDNNHTLKNNNDVKDIIVNRDHSEKNGGDFAETYKERVKNAIDRGIAAYLDHQIDLSYFPEDVRETIEQTCVLWSLRPPKRVKKGRGAYAQWIEDARELIDACGEFGVSVLKNVRESYDKYMDEHSGLAPYTVSGPGSLVKVARAAAGRMRDARNHQQNQQNQQKSAREKMDEELRQKGYITAQEFYERFCR